MYAPWLVPIAIANESTPVLLTNSSACAGSVYLASSADTFNSLISTSFQSLVAELGDGIAHNSQFYGLILNTAALLMMLPLIIGYLFVQRLFVESIERTGITGM